MHLINRIHNTKPFSKFKYRTVKTLVAKTFGELQQFIKFFGNFRYFHFHNNFFLQFTKDFSVKLPTVLLRQTFLPSKFLLYVTHCYH